MLSRATICYVSCCWGGTARLHNEQAGTGGSIALKRLIRKVLSSSRYRLFVLVPCLLHIQPCTRPMVEIVLYTLTTRWQQHLNLSAVAIVPPIITEALRLALSLLVDQLSSV
jgi:hypothetical protein